MALLSKNTDIVFIIDKSGSMRNYISKAVATLSNFADSLKDENVTYRLGLVEYEGSDNTFAHTYTNSADSTTSYFTTDVEAFKNELNSISDDGWREDGMFAIQTAFSMDFNEGADKRFIVLTDENYSNGQSVDSSVIQSALAANGVILDVVGTAGSCRSAWEPIANNTTGKFYLIDYTTTQEDMSNILRNITQNIVYGDSNTMHMSRWSYSFGSSTTLTSAADLIEDNNFAYTYGNGNVIIDNANKGDVINLYDVTLDKITSAEISTGAVNIKFNDGGSLTVLGENNNSYIVGRDVWTANQQTQTWSKA